MASEFSVDHAYDVDVPTLFALLTDASYLEAKFLATGFTEVEILAAGPAKVELTRTTAPPLPGFVKKVLGGKQKIHETQDWTAGDRPQASFRGDSAGTPVKISGTVTVDPAGDSSVLRIRGRVDVSVPLVGGKIADFVAGEATKSLDREYDFTRAWLAER
ncbi:MAG TPA: DUF2505 domain-containing protein [Mycobacteriales bacterium]